MTRMTLFAILVLLVVRPALAQDALVLSPDGIQPWMRMPGGRAGGDLWIPMAPPIGGGYAPGSGSAADVQALRQEMNDFRRSMELQQSLDAIEREINRLHEQRYERMRQNPTPWWER